MNPKAVFLLLTLIALSIFTIKYVGFVSQGTVPSTVTVVGPEVPPSPGGGAGGGGSAGGDPTGGKGFTIEPDLIHSIIKQGNSQRKVIRVKNIQTSGLSISVDSDLIGELLALSPAAFYLGSGESRDVIIDVFATEDQAPDAYVGTIDFSGGGITKTANVIIEVQELEPLFDIRVDLERTNYIPGEDVLFTLYITNNGDLKNIDVKVYYAIRDFDKNTFTFKEESIAIDKSLSMIRQLRIPENAKFGNYVVYASVQYEETKAATSELFNVGDIVLAPFFTPKIIVWIVMIIIILVLLWIIFVLWRRRNKEYECLRCGHEWKGKGDKRPETCPRCRSYYWDRPKPRLS